MADDLGALLGRAATGSSGSSTALEANADWLTTVTPCGWLAEHPPIGRVYVPTGSYAEMGEWALPRRREPRRSRTSLHARAGRSIGRSRAGCAGRSWRNYQVKYREVNDLHKQMLRTSAKVDAMAAGPARDRALDHLYQGQSNDCYWHGLFGGVYISHMRLATYEHLIAAEDLAETGGRARSTRPSRWTSTSTASTRSGSRPPGRS